MQVHRGSQSSSIHRGQVHVEVQKDRSGKSITLPNTISSGVASVDRELGDTGVCGKTDSFVCNNGAVVTGLDTRYRSSVGTGGDSDGLDEVVAE